MMLVDPMGSSHEWGGDSHFLSIPLCHLGPWVSGFVLLAEENFSSRQAVK